MWNIVKIIDFCYGHRLMDYDGKCKYPHGHNGRVEIVCEGTSLDDKGMVVDFGDIKDVAKKFIDDNWDHKMLLRKDDPLVEEFKKRGEPTYLFDENPTAETFSKHLYDVIKESGLPITEVRFYETPDSVAIYKGE